MIADEAPLLEDPLFQLNFTLWMLQTLPKGVAIRPVLREAGYVLDSVGRDLPLPPKMRPALTRMLGNANPPAPDLLAQAAVKK